MLEDKSYYLPIEMEECSEIRVIDLETKSIGFTSGIDFMDVASGELPAYNTKSVDCRILDSDGNPIFEQLGVEAPEDWDENSIVIAADKYFYGELGSEDREDSIFHMIGRVVKNISEFGLSSGYFETEDEMTNFARALEHILITQKAAFNSPVWFNIGNPYTQPASSACFINKVEDTLESIYYLSSTEGKLFKYGSGTGSNLSAIRSSVESLSGGGKASGPVSFMKLLDAGAGVIKSGGRSRRSAKMIILNDWHPDIWEFIHCKTKEEKKALDLIKLGYDGSMTGEVYSNIFYQNANHSVMLSDEFMEAYKEKLDYATKYVTSGEVHETFPAEKLMREIAEHAWSTGDPGVMFYDTIQEWHTCKETGPINSTNPCAEFVFLDDTACNLASINLVKMARKVYKDSDSDSHFYEFDITEFMNTVKVMITAQEILVSMSAYPKYEIAINSHDYRPLGLGFANLGGLLMLKGLPYASKEARQLAAGITSLMTATAYKQSSVIADRMGAFNGYQKNKKSFEDVMKKHKKEHLRVQYNLISSSNETQRLFEIGDKVWDDVISACYMKTGFRNSQVTVLAPTGCVTEDTLIPTRKGLKRITEFGDTRGSQWQDIKEYVMTDEGEKEATKFFVNGKKDVIRLSLSNGQRFSATPNHQIKVVSRDTGEFVWRRMDQIRKDDIVPVSLSQFNADYWDSLDKETLVRMRDFVVVEHHNCHDELNLPLYMTDDLSYLVGLFMGDGSFHKKGLRFCVEQSDPLFLENVVSLIRKVFSISPTVEKDDGYFFVNLNSVIVRDWWETQEFTKISEEDHNGKGYTPIVPSLVLRHKDFILSFLAGLIDSDGTVLKSSGLIEISSKEKSFLEECQKLFLYVGLPSTLSFSHKGGFSKKDVFRLRLKSLVYSEKFLEMTSLKSKKQEKLREILSKKDLSNSNEKIRVFLPRQVYDDAFPVGSKERKTSIVRYNKDGCVSKSLLLKCVSDNKTSLAHKFMDYHYFSVSDISIVKNQNTYDLSVPENVTYLANGIISHNTIGFLMGCTTFGVEPEFSLIKYKKMADGGLLKTVSGLVKPTLDSLGYSDKEISEIVDYIDEKGYVEGCECILDEHLPIFDTAVAPEGCSRYIKYMDHLYMTAILTPFLSGGISKTINMPEHATVEDIQELYVTAHELGCKNLALYRNNSKGVQPLNTSIDDKDRKRKELREKMQKKLKDVKESRTEDFTKPRYDAIYEQGMRWLNSLDSDDPILFDEEREKMIVVDTLEGWAERQKLPDTRDSITHKFKINGIEGYLTVGLYDNSTPGELFVKISKEGSTMSGLLDAWAVLFSNSLQAGVPLKQLISKFVGSKFEPSGWSGEKRIGYASSIPDYICRWLALQFLPEEDHPALNVKPAEIESDLHHPSEVDSKLKESELEEQSVIYGNACTVCGDTKKVLVGTCHYCQNCGTSDGCS